MGTSLRTRSNSRGFSRGRGQDCGAVAGRRCRADEESKLTRHGLLQYYVKLTEKMNNRKLNDLLDALELNQVDWRVYGHSLKDVDSKDKAPRRSLQGGVAKVAVG